ncbi:hypothetical protein ALQ48_03318 [Pseudomonas coronafaciens pv. zizaniae]|nr:MULTISPECIES: hypothetical protein [Pseudomonas syringae group]RMO06944.1 hypothetical protein ALQ48_03318 [Pseudomonas coronafaciens pv. zizaniae]
MAIPLQLKKLKHYALECRLIFLLPRSYRPATEMLKFEKMTSG